MLDLANRPKLGPYILTRELEACAAFGSGGLSGTTAPAGAAASGLGIPQRFLALHSSDQSSHVAYRFPAIKAGNDERRFQAAADSASRLNHAHILTIEQYGIDALGHPWVITPFTGDVDGVRPLSRLLREKGGQMDPLEVERAMDQLLKAVAAAHAEITVPALSATAGSIGNGAESGTHRPPPSLPLIHGPMSIDEILVDRRGALMVELYGLARTMRPSPRTPTLVAEMMRDEVRSVVEIGYQLITGLRAEEPIIPAGRLVPSHRLDRRIDAWLARGLDPTTGFDSAVQAMLALPSHAGPHTRPSRLGTVRNVLSRLRATPEL